MALVEFQQSLITHFTEFNGQSAALDGAAHGALAMTTPGDTSMATFDEVQKLMKGGGARVDR